MLTWSLNVLLALAAPADLILTGGHVLDDGRLAPGVNPGARASGAPAPAGLRPRTPVATAAVAPGPTALAIRDGRVLALGSDAAIEALAGPRTGRVALRGATVLPGLTDAHLHVESLGASLEQLDLVGVASLAEARARVREAAAALPAGAWLQGRGWDQNDWKEQRWPTASDLDAGDHPAFLTRIDGHAAWVNARALALAGIGDATPDPPGGRILRDAAGHATGVLVDAAMDLAQARIPAPDEATRLRRLQRGLEACARFGLTGVHDAGLDLPGVALYKRLLAEGRLPVRVYVMLASSDFLAAGEGLTPEVGLGDGLLTVRAVKAYADGALGSRGALLLEPYADEPRTRGLLALQRDDFARLLRLALQRGFQVGTHAIGDAANRLVLDAYAAAFGQAGGTARRFRIEHAQVVSPEDLPRFKALGVIPSMQPTHCTSDMPWAGARLGPQRLPGAYRWRSFLDQGLPLPGGSDAPVESADPRLGLYAAITRQDREGQPAGGWQPQERVSALEALAMFTRHAAFAAFEEDERGSLAPGRRADLTVLDRDPLAVAPAELLQARVLLTLVGGRVVHEAAR